MQRPRAEAFGRRFLGRMDTLAFSAVAVETFWDT